MYINIININSYEPPDMLEGRPRRAAPGGAGRPGYASEARNIKNTFNKCFCECGLVYIHINKARHLKSENIKSPGYASEAINIENKYKHQVKIWF